MATENTGADSDDPQAGEPHVAVCRNCEHVLHRPDRFALRGRGPGAADLHEHVHGHTMSVLPEAEYDAESSWQRVAVPTVEGGSW